MLNNKPSTSCPWFLCFGTRPRHQTRAPWLGPPRLKNAKSNFFTNLNILHTLKKEPLNIMLLHTSRTMDGPWIKTVPIVSHIFYVSSSTGLGIEGYLTFRKPQPRNESSKICTDWEFWGLNNKPSSSCHCPLLLANGSYALALGRDTKPGHHGFVRPDSRRQNLIFFTNRNILHSLKKEPLNKDGSYCVPYF